MKLRPILQSPEVDTPTAPPTAAPAAPAPSPTASSPSPAPEPAPAPAEKAGIWPDNWRETVTKEDAKALTMLQRYHSPEDAIKALVHAQRRISAGELLPALEKNASPEKLKEWRAANGIPEAPDKYDISGVKLSDEGKKSIMEKYLPVAHKTNQTPEQVKANLQFITEQAQADKEARYAKDVELLAQYQDELREEWGAAYKTNLNLIHGVLDGAVSPAFKDKILSARMDDGTPIGSSPEMLRFLMHLALIQNPAGTVVPGSGGNPLKGTEDEIARIEKYMRTNRADYNKNEKMQADYRQLLEARDKLQGR